jgi:hypothetical protein
LPATEEVIAAAERLRTAFEDLVGRAHTAGVLRADFGSADIPLLLEHLTARIPVTGERVAELHLRYLDLVLIGLHASATAIASALPGPAPDWAELRELWNAPAGG